MIRTDETASGVALVGERGTADIYVDESDASVVRRATGDFQGDVERVTGESPELVTTATDLSNTAVVVGTLGDSHGVERCLRHCTVDTSSLEGEHESFVIQTVENPLPHVDDAVLVVGSDRRGTAYGVYELSKGIGVSPWYWWADVEPKTRETLVVESGCYAFGPPSVTYRGVFLNDEDFGLRPWASKTFAPEDAADRDGIGQTTYARLFELLLRLKANTVWPAMHPGTKAFYRYDGMAELADSYAIVVGTSHCEPMHRNNVDEWEDAFGEWNYATNDERIRAYWRERVESVAAFENVFTLGMRGIHDSGMPGGETMAEKRALLQSVLDDQRELIAQTHDRPAEAVPQVFCPYKEVLDIYRDGLDVPEDVCLMWPDDSHGYIRELPTETERERAGGSGVYYHLSYWGRPHDYLWLSSVPLGVVSTEMRKAYAAGAQECWVVNVGDVKPTEKEMEFFLELAWDVSLGSCGSSSSWLTSWARREFGGSVAAETVVSLLNEYARLSLARKPEHMGWSTVYPDTSTGGPKYSFTHAGDEARRRVQSFATLVERAEACYERLPASKQPSFYQLVLHQIRCSAAMSAKYLHAARSRLYADQGRASANGYADAALAAHDRIQSETRYYNETMLDGKWNRMQSASPRDLPVFDAPEVARVTPTEAASMGVAIESRESPLDSESANTDERSLPTFHSDIDAERFVDVFNYGSEPFEWDATTDEPWLTLNEWNGTVTDERRLWVGVDWDAVPDGETIEGSLIITGAESVYRVGVEAVAADIEDEDGTAEFREVNGVVAVEAEHWSRRVDGSPGEWRECDVPGRLSGRTVAVEPAVFASHDADAETETAPSLEYDIELATAGTVTVDVQCLPTQALNTDRDLRYAVAFDDGPRTVISLDPDGGEHDPAWQTNVLRGAAIGTTTHDVTKQGDHTLRLWALDPGLVVDRLVVYADGERVTYLGPRETRVGDGGG